MNLCFHEKNRTTYNGRGNVKNLVHHFDIINTKIPTTPSKSTTNVHEIPTLMNINYNIPSRNDMIIVFAYFNFGNSVRIAQNALFVKNMFDKAEIPYYIGEVCIKNEPFFFQEAPNVVRFTTNSYMFYKENIFNLIEKSVPNKFTKICMIDFDLFFDDVNWYDKLSIELDDVDICQPFNTAYWLNANFRTFQKKKSSFVRADIHTGHHGFAWGFKRDFIKSFGLPQYNVLGSGDTELVHMITNTCNIHTMTYIPIELTFFFPKDTKTSFLDISIYHLYHGSLKNRYYVNRHKVITNFLKKKGLLFTDILVTNSIGLLEWEENIRNEINDILKEYFLQRRDDYVE